MCVCVPRGRGRGRVAGEEGSEVKGSWRSHLAVLALFARQLSHAERGEDGPQRVLQHLCLLPGLGVDDGIPLALVLLRDLRHFVMLCVAELSLVLFLFFFPRE